MSALRSLIRGLAERAGYEIRRLPTRLAPEARHGLDVFVPLVDALVDKHGAAELTLLQVGANDGVSEDDVSLVLARHAIRSLLCEPLPDAFAKLENTYAEYPHVRLSRCAVATEDGELSLYRIALSHSNPDSSKIASFDKTHVENFIRLWDKPPAALVVERVPCRTVRSLLAEHELEKIDIAVIDVEGMDDVVCEQLLDLDRPPALIKFEYSNLQLAKTIALMKRLTVMGYAFVRGGLDITAARAL